VQDSPPSIWTPPGGTLGRILEETRRRLPTLEGGKLRGNPDQPRPSLAKALRRETVGIIAELKRRSPSKGVLNNALNAGQSVLFERGGAAAISVLTEPEFFGGTLDDLVAVRAAVGLPLLRKDFHIDGSQLVEARMAQASAVLLIARALSPEELPKLMLAAKNLELEVLVEVRSESELERALDAGAEIIGVNSRDLETLEVDERVPKHLMPLIPPHVIGVWESGVHDAEGVERAASRGADAVLVGSALSRSSDPEGLVRALSNVPRQGRRG
jgi:indole-3-glycerol phosphate synthase